MFLIHEAAIISNFSLVWHIKGLLIKDTVTLFCSLPHEFVFVFIPCVIGEILS